MIEITDILIIFLFAKIFGDLAERKNISSIVGHVICGIAFGPFILGIIYPGKEIELLADIGLLVIMLYAGLKSDYSELIKAKYKAIIIGFFGVAISFVLLFSGLLFLKFDLIPSLFVSIILANTAVEIIGGLVANEKNEEISHIILGASFFDDIIAMYLLGLLSTITIKQSTITMGDLVSVSLKIIFFFGITILISEFLISSKGPRIVKYLFLGDKHKSIMVIFIFALVLAIFGSFIGLHQVTGSFLAGLILSRIKEKEDPMLEFRIRFNEVTCELDTLMRFFFMPVFFVYIGLLFNRESSQINIFTLLVLFLGIIGGKIIGCGFGSKLFGLSNRNSLLIGVGMCGRGSMELAVIRFGYSNEIITSELYSSAVIVILISIIITPIMFGRLIKKTDT